MICGPWTPEQVQVLQRNPSMSGAEIKPLIDALGPARSCEAIASKRRELPRQQSLNEKAQSASDRVRRAISGWPNVAAGPIEQDLNFQRALFADMKREGMVG